MAKTCRFLLHDGEQTVKDSGLVTIDEALLLLKEYTPVYKSLIFDELPAGLAIWGHMTDPEDYRHMLLNWDGDNTMIIDGSLWTALDMATTDLHLRLEETCHLNMKGD
jgi:hypothetical protein